MAGVVAVFISLGFLVDVVENLELADYFAANGGSVFGMFASPSIPLLCGEGNSSGCRELVQA